MPPPPESRGRSFIHKPKGHPKLAAAALTARPEKRVFSPVGWASPWPPEPPTERCFSRPRVFVPRSPHTLPCSIHLRGVGGEAPRGLRAICSPGKRHGCGVRTKPPTGSETSLTAALFSFAQLRDVCGWRARHSVASSGRGLRRTEDDQGDCGF